MRNRRCTCPYGDTPEHQSSHCLDARLAAWELVQRVNRKRGEPERGGVFEFVVAYWHDVAVWALAILVLIGWLLPSR